MFPGASSFPTRLVFWKISEECPGKFPFLRPLVIGLRLSISFFFSPSAHRRRIDCMVGFPTRGHSRLSLLSFPCSFTFELGRRCVPCQSTFFLSIPWWEIGPVLMTRFTEAAFPPWTLAPSLGMPREQHSFAARWFPSLAHDEPSFLLSSENWSRPGLNFRFFLQSLKTCGETVCPPSS